MLLAYEMLGSRLVCLAQVTARSATHVTVITVNVTWRSLILLACCSKLWSDSHSVEAVNQVSNTSFTVVTRALWPGSKSICIVKMVFEVSLT